MTDPPDKTPEKKDPLDNLRDDANGINLSKDIYQIPGISKQKKAINDIVDCIRDFHQGKDETAEYLQGALGHDVAAAYLDEMSRQKIYDILPSGFSHENASRAKNIVNDSLIAGEKCRRNDVSISKKNSRGSS